VTKSPYVPFTTAVLEEDLGPASSRSPSSRLAYIPRRRTPMPAVDDLPKPTTKES